MASSSASQLENKADFPFAAAAAHTNKHTHSLSAQSETKYGVWCWSFFLAAGVNPLWAWNKNALFSLGWGAKGHGGIPFAAPHYIRVLYRNTARSSVLHGFKFGGEKSSESRKGGECRGWFIMQARTWCRMETIVDSKALDDALPNCIYTPKPGTLTLWILKELKLKGELLIFRFCG